MRDSIAAPMKCKVCGSRTLRREPRRGFLRKMLLSWFGFFPWRCEDCYAVRIYRARRRGSA